MDVVHELIELGPQLGIIVAYTIVFGSACAAVHIFFSAKHRMRHELAAEVELVANEAIALARDPVGLILDAVRANQIRRFGSFLAKLSGLAEICVPAGFLGTLCGLRDAISHLEGGGVDAVLPGVVSALMTSILALLVLILIGAGDRYLRSTSERVIDSTLDRISK